MAHYRQFTPARYFFYAYYWSRVSRANVFQNRSLIVLILIAIKIGSFWPKHDEFNVTHLLHNAHDVKPYAVAFMLWGSSSCNQVLSLGMGIMPQINIFESSNLLRRILWLSSITHFLNVENRLRYLQHSAQGSKAKKAMMPRSHCQDISAEDAFMATVYFVAWFFLYLLSHPVSKDKLSDNDINN